MADYAATVDGAAGTGSAFVFSGVDGSLLQALYGREPGGGFGPGRAFADIDSDGYMVTWSLVRGLPTNTCLRAAG